MKTTCIYLLLIHLAIAVLSACGPSRPEIIPIDPAFGKYVSGYTSGMINRNDAIRIELATPSEELTTLSEDELSALFESEPHVAGKVFAIGDRILEFVPEEPLAVNQFYTMRFDLSQVADVESKYEEFIFQFATNSQIVDVHINGLRPYNSYNIEYLKLEGYITTSQEEDTTLVKQLIQARLGSTALNVRFTEHYYTTSHFTIDSIRRGDEAQQLVIQWDGSVVQSMSRGQKVYNVPAMGDFSVNEISVRESDDQQVDITFSEPLDQHQELEGLITIGGVEKLTYKINRNVITAFLPKRYTGTYNVRVHSGIKNIAGYRLKTSFEDEITLHEAFPKIKMSGNGTILPNSQGLIFPFEAIALKSATVRIIRIYEKNVHYFLQVNDLNGDDELTRFGKIIAEEKIDFQKDKKLNLKQWNTHIIHLDKLIKAEPGAIYQVAIKFDRTDAICDCPEEESETFDPENYSEEDDHWNEAYWHTYGFSGYSTWSYYDDENTTPCDENYYYGKAITRNILASDIGMIFKLDEDKTSHAFLSDMVSTEPVANATIEYFDYSKKLIAKTSTDGQGMASVHLKEKPFLMIASKGNQRGYLKLTDGHVNSLSKFDVSGEHVQKGIKGYIYGERGVWRPGDSLYLTFMLQDQLKQLPTNHPVKFELFDPHGNVIFQQSKNKHLNGVYDFRTVTSREAPTGNYRAVVHVGNKEFSKYLKIETVKPNRLKIRLDVDKSSRVDSCSLEAKWLHGASAKDLDASVTVNLVPLQTRFKGFDGYTFDSPIRAASSDPQVVFTGKLDAFGKARFASRMEQLDDAAGMMQANYITKVYEKSGNFSIDRTVSSFSPFETYIGMRAPQGSKYDQTLETDHTHRFELVALRKDGTKASKQQLHIQVFRLGWNWWYDGNDNNLTDFTARTSTLPVYDEKKSTSNGITYFDFDVKYPDYGQFLILVTDLTGGHQTGKVVNIDWPYWNRGNRTDNEFASMLSFSLDKEHYVKGETVQLSFPSPSEGRALISIETSRKVLQKFWINTQKGETFHTFQATADMAPNAFIHVTLIQPHHATKNDLPIRMYGVKPLLVEDPDTRLHPLITVPDVIRPESTVEVAVKEQSGRKMTYTLAIVDDGLLDLTAFRTPQPHDAFYAREALGVKTWDMYDDVIGAYSGQMDNLYTIGGDASEIAGRGLKANRFEPMVRYLGPFELPAGKSKTHRIAIPNYVGSVRVMVVARDHASYGNAQKTVTVKKPLMLLATLPRVLGPNETFSLPVDVFAMEKHIRNVQVKLESNEQFELLDSPSKSIQFSSEGDQVINFKLKAKNKLGIGKLKISAKSGNETATQLLEIDVRPSNPVTYTVKSIEIAPGKSAQLDLHMDGIPGTNRGVIEYSTLPAIQLEKRIGYLIHYPHGCVEQTTSAVFPQLYLSKLSATTEAENQEITKNIKAGLKRLQRFQTSEGGFAYWPGESQSNEWGSNYAGHFMLEAEAAGYQLPARMKERWLQYQRNSARNWTLNSSSSDNTQEGEQLTQAYRLYLLALANTAEIGAMNRLRESKKLGNAARWRLASAYFLIGQKETAQKLGAQASETLPSYRELSGTFGSSFRDRSVILESMVIMQQREKAGRILKQIAKELSSDQWLSTQETAYGLLAVAHYANGQHSGSVTSLSVSGSHTASLKTDSKVRTFKVSDSGKSQKQTVYLKNTGSSSVYVTSTVEKIEIAGKEEKKQSQLEISVEYTDFYGQPLNVSKLKQGTEFTAVVTLKNPSKTEYYKEMCLEQIFPGGWEIHNTRLFGGQGTETIRFQDIRDDRVYSYFHLAPGKSITIHIQLNATYLGNYYLPAVYSEAMYDHTIHAQVPGKWITVE